MKEHFKVIKLTKHTITAVRASNDA